MTEIPPELNDIIKDVDSNGSGAHPRRWVGVGNLQPSIVGFGGLCQYRDYTRVLLLIFRSLLMGLSI